jgi:uncharacterized protein YjbI with pentapeptide repeats
MNKYTITFNPVSKKSPIELEGKTISDAISKALDADIDLTFADFSGEQLAYVDFSGCDLTSCDFSGVEMYNCEFQGANLSKTDWTDAVVKESWFQSCKWDDSSLLFAAFVACDVREADFRLARHIQTAAFSNLFDAILPENYHR